MDENKKKFELEIEYDDDFDKWLEQHDEEKKKEAEQEAAAQKAVTPQDTPVPKRRPAPPEIVSDEPHVDRRSKVKDFQLHIDEKSLGEPTPVPEEQPEHKPKNGAIYFANHELGREEAEKRRQQTQRRLQAEKKAAAEKKRRERKKLDTIRVGLVLFILFVSTGLLSFVSLSCVNDVLALNRDNEVVKVNIPQDADYKQIIGILADNDLVKNPGFCKAFAKFRNYNKRTFLNGVYYLTADMGCEGMLNAMREAKATAETKHLTFPEGWSIPQIVSKLEEYGVCKADYLYAALKEVDFDYGFVGKIPISAERYQHLEGYLFPDTYDFYIGENANSVVRKFLANFETKWDSEKQKKADNLGMSIDQIIIIASIIEKEAANEEQMADVSSVIHNRLSDPVNTPTLGCDSTKNYVTTYLKAVLGDAGISRYFNAYDTSTRSGLPAGPICNPGEAAIDAALEPADTKYVFFCHDNNGKLYLAKTYSEHQANWSKVLKVNASIKD